MASATINAWMEMEGPNYENFGEFIANMMEEAFLTAIPEFLKRKLMKDEDASLTLPWGTYSAKMKTKGEPGSITPTWEPTSGFLDLMNSQGDEKADQYQDDFDPDYMKLVVDWMGHGVFDVDEHPEQAAKQKGIQMEDAEIEYMLNSYARMLARVAKEHQRDGKEYRLDVVSTAKHGTFVFEYSNDEIKVTFIAHKSFKQDLKNDDAVMEAVS